MFLLKIASLDMKLLMKTTEAEFNDDVSIMDTRFSLDSKLMLLVDQGFSVFNCDAQQLAHIKTAPHIFQYALAQDSKIAVSLRSKLQVWDLASGDLLGTLDPPVTASCSYGSSLLSNSDVGPVVADPTGRKLAFMPAGSRAVLLYSALNLKLLACVSPSSGLHSLSNYTISRLKWGTWRWLTATVETKKWQAHELQLDSGSNTYGVLQCAVQPGSLLALSPDGAFECRYQSKSRTIRVSDIRTEQLMFAYAINLVQDLPGLQLTDHLNTVDGRWSSCGSWLMITVCVLRSGPYQEMEYVLLLHI